MLIRSQNKEVLTDDFNLQVLDNGNLSDVPCSIMNKLFTLGEYSTKEKAINVLDWIQCEYERKIAQQDFKYPTFQMPQDNEVEV